MKQQTHNATDFFTTVEELLPWKEFAFSVLCKTDNPADEEDPQQVQDMVQSIKFYFLTKWYKISAQSALQLVQQTSALQTFLQYDPFTEAPLKEEDFADFETYVRKHKLPKEWRQKVNAAFKKEHIKLKPGKVSGEHVLEHPTLWNTHHTIVGSGIRVVLATLPFVLFCWFLLHAYDWHTSHTLEQVEIYDIKIETQEEQIKAHQAVLDAMKEQMNEMEAALATSRRDDPDSFNDRVNEFNAFVKEYNKAIEAFNALEQEYTITVELRNKELSDQQNKWFLTEYFVYLKEKIFGKQMVAEN